MMAQEVEHRFDVAVESLPPEDDTAISLCTWPAIRSYFLRIVWRISK